ncbi:MAG TPA: hypothetical protein O0X39_03020 [Methanocorpusculum sp.]|nr:hypothetical protein [Methanocorpusculum sp.]
MENKTESKGPAMVFTPLKPGYNDEDEMKKEENIARHRHHDRFENGKPVETHYTDDLGRRLNKKEEEYLLETGEIKRFKKYDP